jgi:hypothetical protein
MRRVSPKSFDAVTKEYRTPPLRVNKQKRTTWLEDLGLSGIR